MVKTIQMSNFKYSYDYKTGRVTDLGDYAKFPIYSTALDLRKESPSISKKDGRLSQENRNTFGLIQLCVPVLNYALAGSSGSILCKILNIHKETFKAIMNCDLYYDETTGEEVTSFNINASHKYLVGSVYIYKLIDDLDVEKETINLIVEKIASKCYDTSWLNDTEVNDLVIRTDNAADDHKIISNIALNPKYDEHLQKDFRDKIDANLEGQIHQGKGSRLTILLNMPKDKSPLYGMVAPFMIVLPYDYRISTGSNQSNLHPTSVLYQRVIETNASLLAYTNSFEATSNIYKESYRNLEDAVNAVYYDKKYIHTRGDTSAYKSILEKLKGKHGIIREQCLGKRQDYSGRSVVTIAPYLSLNRINLPKDMILSMFEYHALPELMRRLNVAQPGDPLYGKSILDLHGKNLEHSEILKNAMFEIITEKTPHWDDDVGDYVDKSMLDCIPVYMGRQPTLHKHSYQSFFVGVSPTNSIQVNPLVCPGYNMDFDGDQAYVNIPLHPKAAEEVEKLMCTAQTVYLAKTGKSTIEPRQDMLYGLYICTNDDNINHAGAVTTKITTLEEAFNAVCTNKYAVWDIATINGKKTTLGDAAFMACFKPGDMPDRDSSAEIRVRQVGKKTIGSYVDYILNDDDSIGHKRYSLSSKSDVPGTFVGTINRLVKLGFDIARYYPPSVSIIDTDKVVGDIEVNGETFNYETYNEQLHALSEEADFFYTMGLDTASTYQEVYGSYVDKISACIDKGVSKSLDKHNGYKLMADSGARGDNSNLAQIFKYKGQIQKDAVSSFDIIVANGYKQQLSPMEFFIDSYGGRQGQIDKSLKTAETGYFARGMWHATQGYVITSEDCGTDEGVEISYEFMNAHFPDSDPAMLLEDWLCDHHLISIKYPNDYEEKKNNILLTADIAHKLVKENDKATIYKLRSPLYCKNPCCKMCYGIDPCTHEPPVIGTAVGLISAQSIGEISTQATMKAFQKGGSAGASSVSSAYERAEKLIGLTKLDRTTPGYDPVAWVDGKVSKKKSDIPGTYRIEIEPTDRSSKVKYNRTILVDNSVDLLPFVKKGVGISRIRGDYSMRELIEIMGVDYASKYLVAKLRSVYSSVAKLKFIHYEILVASLTRYMILETDRNITEYYPDGRLKQRSLIPGCYVTAQELYCGDLLHTRYVKRLVGFKFIMDDSLDALDAIQKERQGSGVANDVLLHMSDTLNKPLNRLVVSKGLLSGSHLENYIDECYRR